MGTQKWDEIADERFSPEAREKMKLAARAELERVGLAALRKAREQTQVELAGEMGLPQSSISDMERRADLLLTTLRKYIEALGGELELVARFPEAEFALDIFGAGKTNPRTEASKQRPIEAVQEAKSQRYVAS